MDLVTKLRLEDRVQILFQSRLLLCFSGFDEPWLNRQEVNRVVITPRLRLIGDSRSTGRLHSPAAHRSMTKLNNGKPLFISMLCFLNSQRTNVLRIVSAVSNTKIGSTVGLHKSMTKLSSNQLNCQQQNSSVVQSHITRAITSNGYAHQYTVNAAPSSRIYCGGITVTTRDNSPTKSIL